MVIIDKNTVRLCRAGSCCPVIKKINDNSFSLEDDHGGSVTLTKEELSILKETIEHFEK